MYEYHNVSVSLFVGRDAGVVQMLQVWSAGKCLQSFFIASSSPPLVVFQAMCSAQEIVASLILRREDKKTLREIKEKHGHVPCKRGTAGLSCWADYVLC
jgi:hypothetical protein